MPWLFAMIRLSIYPSVLHTSIIECYCLLYTGLISLCQKKDFSSGVLASNSLEYFWAGVSPFYTAKYENFSLTRSFSLGYFGKMPDGYFCVIWLKWHQEFGSRATGHSSMWGQGAITLASFLDLVCITHSLNECMNLYPLGLPGSTTIITPFSFSLCQSASIINDLPFADYTSWRTYPRMIRSNLPLSPDGIIANESTQSTSFSNWSCEMNLPSLRIDMLGSTAAILLRGSLVFLPKISLAAHEPDPRPAP